MPRLVCFLVLVLASSTFAQGARGESRAAGAVAPGKTAYLGVRVARLDEESRRTFRIPAEVTAGVVIAECLERSPALRAGLRAGDVVTRFHGKPVRSPEELVVGVRACAPGSRVTYVVRRGTGTIAGTLTLGARATGTAAPERAPEDLDTRLDHVQRDIEKLRQRLLEARRVPERLPRTLDGWIEREERALETFRKTRETEKIRFHVARLSVLREMKRAGAELPSRRLERMERKLDALLEVLEEWEEELDED